MKKELVLKILFYSIIILVLFFTFNKLDKYLDAKIQYESVECFDRAYIINKYYDDQIPEHKTRDWSLRDTKCAEIKGKYQMGF